MKSEQAVPVRRAGAPAASTPGGEKTGPFRRNLPSWDVPVVGVGASAGGFDAFTELLRALPSEPGFAIVFVQHLSPTHESSLVELLSRLTALPVEQATDGVRLVTNRVYVVPPNAQLRIDHGRLRVSVRPTDRTQYNPIDVFFRSLAEAPDGRAFAVLLAGSSADGVAGLREIRATGGTVLVQDPDTTDYQTMPRAAISAGVTDLVLPPAQIASTLVRLIADPLLTAHDASEMAPENAIGDHHLRRIFALLRAVSGVDFSHYKEPTIRRRLQRRMLLQKSPHIDEYIKLLEEDVAEVQRLYQDLLIQVTRFFREPESYVALKEKVFPKLTEARASDNPIRVWVPGCATGEEAYSIAMTLLEFLGDDAGSTPIQVFATDVSDKAIEKARTGVYPASISEDVSPARLRRFFTKVDGNYQIAKAVRDLCVFAHQDLTRDPPFSKLDLIVCRNVLIYLEPALHRRLMSLFHYALKPSGFLMLGRAESTGPHSDLFQLHDKKHRIFIRKMAIARMDLDFHPAEPPPLRPSSGRKPVGRSREGAGIQNEATRILLSRYAPPGVIVDGDLRIVQTRGQTGAFLELAPGEPTLNLLKMLREGLLFGVRAALTEARRNGQAVRRDGLRVKSNGHTRTVDVEVIPVASGGQSERHYLVLFDGYRQAAPDGKDAPAEPVRPRKKGAARADAGGRGAAQRLSDDDPRLLELQQELAASREYLQSIIQDLEATNEELQSANEEILSSNEELQSTNEELDTAKEELQSTNEEINTVNEELQARNEELSRANSDLVNLLAGVQIAIVFVTSDLRIRRFTPMAEKALNLIPSDVGRPIGNIRPNIDCPDLEAVIQEVVDTVTTKEREVQDRDGHRMLLRVRPYKSVENRIDGAVVVLLDIDALRKQELQSQEARELVDAILGCIEEPVAVVDGDLNIVTANRSFLQLAGRPSAPDGLRRLDEVDGGSWDADKLRKGIAEVLASGSRQRVEPLRRGAEAAAQRLVAQLGPIGPATRRPPLVLLRVGSREEA